jgi:phosphate:Na+ symporter
MSSSIPSALVLGLGLFFLGIQLIGQYLRQLSGESFRALVGRTTHSTGLAALVGMVFGFLMQSATAVTFILVGMVSSGVIEMAAALPIIVWCNVGLTGLAFVTTLNIHPLVAYLVGGAGIASGTLRRQRAHAIAFVLLGMGLILFGLQTMGAGLAPLRGVPWFQHMLATAAAYPLLAFVAGIVAAMLLQSNTGTAMLVITLAGAGTLDLHPGAMLIYGSNLGAIALRAFLAIGLGGRALRLVRMEDLFCAASGLLMVVLDLVESSGVPLVRAGVQAFTPDVRVQLALVFLLSNLLPALLLTPALGWCRSLLEWLVPSELGEIPGKPRYLTSSALADPGTAIVLLEKELARLIGMLTVDPTAEQGAADGEHQPAPAFVELGQAIERFAAQLATRGTLSEDQATRLQLIRGGLSTVRHLEDASAGVCNAIRRLGASAEEQAVARGVQETLAALVARTAKVADRPEPAEIRALTEDTKKHGPLLTAPRSRFDPQAMPIPGEARLKVVALLNDLEVAVWIVHRLAKALALLAG